MNKINVLFKSWRDDVPSKGYWDQAFLDDVFSQRIWRPVNGYRFVYNESIETLPKVSADLYTGAIVVIPARQHADPKYIELINKDINKLWWCIVILTGDEEASFPCEKLNHPNMKIYIMTPHIHKHENADRFIINGYPPQTRNILKKHKSEYNKKKLDWFFAGQVTHNRRKKAVKVMRKMKNGKLIETPGFIQGVEREKYLKYMASAKVAPCPSGAVIPDSFRLYEALEAGCMPIVDGKAPKLDVDGYWPFLFGQSVPFYILDKWKDLQGTCQYFADTFPEGNNKVFAWWQQYKRQFVYNLHSDIYELNSQVATHEVADRITVLIPTSAITQHPSTEMIDETIKSIRERLPNCEIIIMFDGLRKEHGKRKSKYEEYKRRMLWKCNYELKNVLPIVFEKHTHQVEMTRQALEMVKTPTIMFVEHDTPLCEDIPFGDLINLVDTLPSVNVIRLNHEAIILKAHKHLYLDQIPQDITGVPLIRTAQWSQRPHIALTSFYRNILNTHFSKDARCMIEDGIHGPIATAYISRGQVGWNDYKIWLYAPEGDMKRSYHLDGRGKDSKHDSKFIY